MRIHLSADEFTQVLANLVDTDVDVGGLDEGGLTIECKPDAGYRLLSALRVEDGDWSDDGEDSAPEVAPTAAGLVGRTVLAADVKPGSLCLYTDGGHVLRLAEGGGWYEETSPPEEGEEGWPWSDVSCPCVVLAEGLSREDVVAICEQGAEEWLRGREGGPKAGDVFARGDLPIG